VPLTCSRRQPVTEAPLQDVGVLVTRPRVQAIELVEAIEAQGGRAYCFPVIEIAPIEELDIRKSMAHLGDPDIVIFVSSNAVEYGIRFTGDAEIAVIGPATAKAVVAAGRVVDIQPAEGFDSEHLLAEERLQEVAGQRVCIIRGTQGRELLAEELKRRGAIVEYLSVYERRLPEVPAEVLTDIECQWRQGLIHVVTAMSVQSLSNLIELLPEWCVSQLESTPLVTPAGRVIKEVLERYPASRPILAPGPGAKDMVQAIIALRSTDSGIAP
jgi:uroporphyrinogen-III synthase